jgi:hypothetical protein
MAFRSLPRICTLVLLLGWAMGCRHTVRIVTEPAGAEVWVNFVRVGRSPVIWEARTGLPELARVKVALEGYEPQRDLALEKDYHADMSLLWLLPGGVPYLFTARFDEEMRVQLLPRGSR